MAQMRSQKPGFPMSLKVYGGGHSLGNAGVRAIRRRASASPSHMLQLSE